MNEHIIISKNETLTNNKQIKSETKEELLAIKTKLDDQVILGNKLSKNLEDFGHRFEA